LLERVEGEARAFLDRQAEEISSAGGEVEGTHLASGNAPARIVKLAEELHADLTPKASPPAPANNSRAMRGLPRSKLGTGNSREPFVNLTSEMAIRI